MYIKVKVTSTNSYYCGHCFTCVDYILNPELYRASLARIHATPELSPASIEACHKDLEMKPYLKIFFAVYTCTNGDSNLAKEQMLRFIQLEDEAGIGYAACELAEEFLHTDASNQCAPLLYYLYQLSMSTHYADGYYGMGYLIQNSAEEIKGFLNPETYFHLAASRGSIKACAALGRMFHLGRDVCRDYKAAIHYYTIAAEGGHIESQYQLASIYHGLEVEEDAESGFIFTLNTKQYDLYTQGEGGDSGWSCESVSDIHITTDFYEHTSLVTAVYWYNKFITTSKLFYSNNELNTGNDDKLVKAIRMIKQIMSEVSVVCGYCKERKDSLSLKTCGRCKCVYYCDGECQKQDWSSKHKQQCRNVSVKCSCGYKSMLILYYRSASKAGNLSVAWSMM